MDKAYVDAVRLLLETISSVFHTPSFVMKGGTANVKFLSSADYPDELRRCEF
jgi:hypothetical protein